MNQLNGAFDATGPLDEHASNEGARLLQSLPDLTPPQRLTHIPMHWAVETYTMGDKAYNVVVREITAGMPWELVVETDPRLNATSPPQEGYAAHTYQRNSFGIGFSVEAMAGASTSNFGQYPVQVHMLEVLCAGVGAAGCKYGIDIMVPQNCYTHAEAADWDGYLCGNSEDPDCRWDLERFIPGADPILPARAHLNGDLLRARAHQYKLVYLALKGKP